MVKPFTIIIGLLFCCLKVTHARDKGADPYFVRNFPQTLTARTFLGEKISTFSLVENGGRRLQYHPNNFLGIGIGATIRGIGLNVNVALPFHDDKEEQYGATKRTDIQVHSYSRKLMLDVYFQRYRGFHLADKEEVTTIIGPQEYPYFPNLRAMTIGASGLFVFNGDRFSLRTIVNQQEWQLHSAGSLLLGASIFTHIIKDEGGILPTFYRYPDFLGGNRPK